MCGSSSHPPRADRLWLGMLSIDQTQATEVHTSLPPGPRAVKPRDVAAELWKVNVLSW